MPITSFQRIAEPKLKALLTSFLLAGTGVAQDEGPDDLRGTWAFDAPRAFASPRVDADTWSRQPLDAFVLHRLRSRGLAPREDTDRRTLLRRVTYTLTGLAPTFDEVEAFARDERPDAYERVVDRLLASPRYGVRLARAWLDVARFGESNGFEHDELRENAWPYRDWVVDALNDDLPYDEFVRRQIAGDVTDDDAVATGFLVAGGFDRVGQEQQSAVGRAVARQDELEEIIATTSQAFLGLTAHCARCHDHPHDPIPQRDYYQLAAAFAGVRRGEREIAPREDPSRTRERERARETLARLERELDVLEKPAREHWLAERGVDRISPMLGEPRWSWEFASEAPAACGPRLELFGNARFTPRGLVLPEGAHARSAVLDQDVHARTLEAVVQLTDLEQRGGAVLSIESLDGARFDAIVFGEREARQWMAGSDFFRRTRDVSGDVETVAHARPVHIAITWDTNGRIQLYRDGLPYGKGYVASPSVYLAGTARLLLGLRHDPPSAGKLLRGTIRRAALHERVLSADEIARRAAATTGFVPEDELLARLDAQDILRRRELLRAIGMQRPLLEPLPRLRAFVVTPRSPEPTYVLRRGDPQAPGDRVEAAGFSCLPLASQRFDLRDPNNEGARRRALAQWITAVDNPLFAKVIVNRVWGWHFGRGLVDTPSDFGTLGARPTHPALLAALAVAFASDGYSLKSLQRQLVTSASFTQASNVDPEALHADQDARFLWRFPPRRLEAEMLLDTLAQAAGTLDERMGGPGDPDFRWYRRSATHYYDPIDAAGDGAQRRALYRIWARGGRNPLLDAFDCPDPSTTAPKRRVTTTPLQALALLDHPRVVQRTRELAASIERDVPTDTRRVDAVFRVLYQRAPDAQERAHLVPFVSEHGLAALARALVNTSEFLHVD